MIKRIWSFLTRHSSRSRIEAVAIKYFDFLHPIDDNRISPFYVKRYNPFAMLLSAGAWQLDDKYEFRKLVRHIRVCNGGKVNWLDDLITEDEIFEFLKWCVKNGYDLRQGSDCAFAIYHWRGKFSTSNKEESSLVIQVNGKVVAKIVPTSFDTSIMEKEARLVPLVIQKLGGRWCRPVFVPLGKKGEKGPYIHYLLNFVTED